MVISAVEMDPVLHALGPLGLFACAQCFLYFLGYFSDAHQLFSYVFTGQDVEHRCASPTNESEALIPELHGNWTNSTAVQYEQCTITVMSNISGNFISKDYSCVYGMEYDAPKDTSIVSEFDLVCDRAALAGLTQTLLSFGGGLGAILFPWLSDLYGRKLTIIVTQFLILVCTLGAAFSPNYAVFAVLKFFTGFIQSGIGLTAVTAGVELFPSSHRAVTSGFFSTLWWALCIASLAPTAYLLRFHSWRILQIAHVGAAAIVIFMIISMKEPVFWLVANGKIKQAERVLKQAAKWNRKDSRAILKVFHGLKLNQTDTDDLSGNGRPRLFGDQQTQGNGNFKYFSVDACVDPEECDLTEGAEEKLGFRDIFRHRLLRKNALVSWFIWFVDSMTYNALYLMSDRLALSLYMNFFLNSVVEGASCLLMLLMLNRLGRKPTVGIFHVIASLGLVGSSVCFIYKDFSTDFLYFKTMGVSFIEHIVGTVLSLIGKMGIGGTFNVMYLYTPEIFPTNIRNRALGMSMAVATAGSMIAPYSDVLADYAVWMPGAVFGTCSLLAAFFLLALPESKGRELPQAIRDLEAWYDVTSSDTEKKRTRSLRKNKVIVRVI